MKNLVHFLLLFSTVVFSQNYQYSIEEARIKPLAAPTGLVASLITQTGADLTWTASTSTSVTEYWIYSNNNLLAKSVGTGTTYKLTGLTPETAYSLTVRTVDKANNISGDSNVLTFTTANVQTVVNNQLEEIEYFKAYLLPISQKANLQTALNTYGSVRLEKGDYSGVNLVVKSNQRLYGHPSLTQVSNITIAAGSKGVVLQYLFLNDNTITFEAGGIISGCLIKSIKWTILMATNAMIENNTFLNIQGRIKFDFSASGYFRNNKFIKFQAGSWSNLMVMKGNSNSPSYGNVGLHINFLTPHGDTTDIDGLQSATFVGIDAEGWNMLGQGTKALFTAKNMGDVKITDFGGGNGYSVVKAPTFNIDAKNLFFFHKYIYNESQESPKVSANTNVFYVQGEHDDYVRDSGAVTGFDFKAHLDGVGFNNDIRYNGLVQSSTITNTTINNNLRNSILGTQYTPWVRSLWEILPDPLGVNWKTDRNSKPDQTAFIQNLINTNGVAELPEGVFYIGSTLKIPLDKTHGIVGKGTGKTVIVGLTDDFPLISLTGGQDANFIFAHLTLQGGSVGVYSSQDYGTQHLAFQNIKFVVFRNQNYGIQLKQIMGFDNNFFDNVSFINCSKGFFQDPFLPWDNNSDKSSFVDKTMFYNGQYINCNTAVSMKATRADNLNAWVNCKFDNNRLVIDMSGNNFPIVANCDFTNNTGEYTISGELSFYNCNFQSNTPIKATFMSKLTFIEGCNFLDNVPMFYNGIHYNANYYILNSKITGNATRTYGMTQAVYVNSSLLSNPTLNKLLVKVKDNIATVLIDDTPNPYPQLLVDQ